MIQRFLRSPLRVFICCLIFAFSSLLLNGGWMNLYSLKRDHRELQTQIVQLNHDLKDLDLQLARSKDPTFIEQAALDQLDMASDQDLVFVFSE